MWAPRAPRAALELLAKAAAAAPEQAALAIMMQHAAGERIT